MSFQTRLLLTYSILIILLVAVLSISFYEYNSNIYESKAYTNLSVNSDKMSRQLDNLIRPMEFVTTYLLSDINFVSSMTTLANLDKNISQNLDYINDSRKTIRGAVLSYAVEENFYRVSVYNNKGDLFTSNIIVQSVNSATDLIDKLSWVQQADEARGSVVIIPPYSDPWAVSDKEKVFGLIRSVQGQKGKKGYIEVQNKYSELERIFSIPNEENLKVIAVTNAGENLYTNGIPKGPLLNYYSKLAFDSEEDVSLKRNLISGLDEIVACTGSSYTGIKFIMVQDKKTLLKPLLFTGKIIILIGILIIAVSLLYIYIFSRQLTKPIRKLKETMEGTDLENLSRKIIFESSNNEIEALNRSFKLLRKRLNEAVQREIKSQALQMQASFDSMQAQVNPHFIYNILNVLSNKGIVNDDEEICEICNGIASMLRYSTSTLKRSATIGDELEHMNSYLMLMKKRFEHKLEFRIEMDQVIFGEAIPKIVLQQIVENSINHGFESIITTMLIEVKGYIADGWWYIEIVDNGQGFHPDMLKKLDDRMKLIRKELFSSEQLTGFAIGGMGLINTYARLVLFYHDNFVFTLENKNNGGTKVTIGSTLGFKGGSDERYENTPN
jgi:two-component system, sensor histidine kinase YesM